MYGPNVNPQITRPSKELITNMTLIFFESGMSFQVPFEFALSYETFAALLAYEGLFLCMCEAVQFQIVMQFESFIAYFAYVLFLAIFFDVFYCYFRAVAF